MVITPIIIDPGGYYSVNNAALLISVSKEHLQSEHNQGRLKGSKRGRRLFIRGQWLIDWIEGDTESSTAPNRSEAAACA